MKNSKIVTSQGGGDIKQVTLLSITTTPSGTFERGSKYYNSTDKLIYTAVEDNTWNNAETATPTFYTIYIYDNTDVVKYYQWDGDNLVETDLEKYQLISNKTDYYTVWDENTYPSSKALHDGLASVKPEIFDIKKSSQAVIGKGWSYLCNVDKQILNKNDIPTVYNKVYTNYTNCSKEVSNFVKTTTGSANRAFRFFFNPKTNLYYYIISNNNIYKIYSSIAPELTDPQLVYTGDKYAWSMNIGNNTILIVCHKFIDGQRYITFDLFDLDFNYLRQINVDVTENIDFNKGKPYFIKDKFIFFSEHNSGPQGRGVSCFIAIEDKITSNSGIYVKRFLQYTSEDDDIVDFDRSYPFSDLMENSYIYMPTVSSRFSYRYKMYKFNVDTLTADLIATNLPATARSNIIFFKNNFYFCSYSSGILAIYKSDNLTKWSNTPVSDLLPTNELIGLFLNFGDSVLCFGTYNIYITYDMVNFTIYESNISAYDSFANYYRVYYKTDDFWYVPVDVSFNSSWIPYNFFGSTLIPKVYTDNYTIEGNIIPIQYYKYNDWKICIADHGINDANLDTVYNSLGYLPYWLLDVANQQLCLQRVADVYTQMYVGDDYIDTTKPLGEWKP